MKNKEEMYWEKFYKTHNIESPSTFAKFIQEYLKQNLHPPISVIELGCGNGRDTYYLGKNGHAIMGIDSACQPKDKKNIKFKKMDLNEIILSENKHDVVYSRFFIHSITDNEIDKLLKWCKNLFVAEFRAKEDEPVLYQKHYRNKIDGNKFIKNLLKYKYDILYYIKSTNLAKYKTENPIIIRIIAKRKIND
jgi:ubiquinone/menaquinone biosynthesis C-methylase UbiE